MNKVISDVRDLRQYVEDRIGSDAQRRDVDRVTARILSDPNRPSWSVDWGEYFLSPVDLWVVDDAWRNS